jgi:DNA-binding winged helix-turn-helix (wHTH) protein/WD40 repeat protein
MSFWFGDFELDQERRLLLRSREPVPLEPKAYELLTLLVERRPRALSRAQIRDAIWPSTFVSESTLAVLVNGIRRALADDARQPRFVRTAHGFGYAFCGDVRESRAGRPATGGGAPEDGRSEPEAGSANDGRVGAAAAEPSPYPGLLAFTEADAERFFGREAEVEALWEKIRRRELLAVIGPSGVGKTSFLRAGVIPSRPPGWASAYATPGTRPVSALARALVPGVAGDAEAVGELLRGVSDLSETGDAGSVVSAVRRWRSRSAEALIVVDQFEELFTQTDEGTRAQVATLIGRIVAEAGVHVVLSLRDDFLFRCSELPPLAPVFESLTPLPGLTAEGVRRALVEPATRCGYRFEDEALVEDMVASVAGERGALPLPAFAVSRLWEERDRGRKLLVREAYERMGGVAGALAQHAEATLSQLGPEREGMVREIFRNLVTVQGTRAAADRAELLSVFGEKRDEAGAMLDALVDARLLTEYVAVSDAHVHRGAGLGGHVASDVDRALDASPRDERADASRNDTGQRRIAIVHESLLTHWPRLARWRTQDADGAQLRDQLKQAAHLWDERGRPDDLLWTGSSYLDYGAWRARYAGGLSSLEEAFAQAMTALANRRRRRRRIAAAAVVAALSVGLGVVSVFWSRSEAARRRADGEALRAEASKLLALGQAQLEVDPTATLAYARKSLEVHDTAEARRLALEALWRGPVASVWPIPKDAESLIVTASPDGRWLACSGWGSVITLVSADGKTIRTLSRNRNAAWPRIVRFSDDSTRLATFASGDPETVVWSVDGQEIARLRPGGYPSSFVGDSLVLVREPGSDRPQVQVVARRVGSLTEESLARFSPTGDFATDGRRGLLYYAKDRAIFSRALGPGPATRADVRIGEHERRVAAVSVHDETGQVVSFDEKREVRIWDPATHRLLRTLEGMDPDRLFSAPILDPEATRLAWQSLRQRAYPLWDLAGPPGAEPLLMHKSEIEGDAGGGTFLAGGRWLVTALSSRVAFWHLPMPWPRVIRNAGSGFAGIAFTPDSRQVVFCGTAATMAYPLVPDAPPAHPLGPKAGFTCYGVAMEPGGDHVLLAATTQALVRAPVDGGPSQELVRVPSTESICAAAVDPAGRWAAMAACYAPDVKDRRLHVVDRRTGAARAFPLPGAKAEDAWSGGVQFQRFVAGGRLIAGGWHSDLRSWNPETGANEVLIATPCRGMDASADGRRFVAACRLAGAAAPVDAGQTAATAAEAGKAATTATDPGETPSAITDAGKTATPSTEPPMELLVFDAATGARRRIDSHGRDIAAVALSPSGDAVATADTGGAIRVGRIDGGEPHLLVGAGGSVTSLAFSPDGRWLGDASGSEIRLWPMPDLSQPPLHTLPREALLAKLDALTNVRVVEDVAAPSGYRIDLAPFPGWKDVPAW